MNALEAMLARRSVSRLTEPGPSEDEVEMLLTAAVCAPDHGELRPWRFVVLQGDEKDAFGEVLVEAALLRAKSTTLRVSDSQLNKERNKLGRAPLVIVVGATFKRNVKIPWEEQFCAAAAAAENICLAATALGFGSMWRTGDAAYDTHVKAALGLAEGDAIVGFIYIGTALNPPKPRMAGAIDIDSVVTYWRP